MHAPIIRATANQNFDYNHLCQHANVQALLSWSRCLLLKWQPRQDYLCSWLCSCLNPYIDVAPTPLHVKIVGVSQWQGSYMQVGHGLAAAAEGVGIHAVSFFLLLVLPGAYVTLNADNLAVLGPLRALNVSSPAIAFQA